MFVSKIIDKLLLYKGRSGLRKILINLSWLFLDRVVRMGFGLIVAVWTARYLGTEQFGVLNYAIAFVALFSPLANLGLDGLLVQRLVTDRSQHPAILGTSFWLRFVAGWLAWFMAILGVFLLRQDDRATMVMVAILSGASVFQSLDTIDLWFQSQVQSKYSVVAKNTAFIIATLGRMLLITMHAPLVAFAWVTLLEFVLGAIGLLIVYKQQGQRIGLWAWNPMLGKNLLRESLPLIFSGLTIMIYMRIDQIMLGQMIGDGAVGIYSAATRISEVWYFVPLAVASSVAPTIYEAKQVSEELYYHRLGQLNRFLVLGAIGIALPMTFLSGTIMTLLFGNKYADSGGVLAIHIWAAVFVFTGVATSSWFVAENLTHLQLLRTLGGAVANVLLNLVLIPVYGVAGAAIATVISQAIAAFFSNAINRQTLKLFKVQIKSLFPIKL
jgi:polysaccharide transporter, PST family